MKVVVLGATGLVGFNLMTALRAEGHDVRGVVRDLPDGMNASAMLVKPAWLEGTWLEEMLAAYRPDVIVNGVATSNVDVCETAREQARALNVDMVARLVEVCRTQRVKLVHFSSAAVFDGKAPPYAEDAPMNPVNFYGETKKRADELVMAGLDDFLILRLTTVFGGRQPFMAGDFIDLIATRLLAREPLQLVTDNTINYVWVEDVVRMTLRLLAQHASGIFHLGGTDAMNRYALGKLVATCLEVQVEDSMIVPVTSEVFSRMAPRPADVTLDTRRVREATGLAFTPLADAVRLVVQPYRKAG